MSAALSYNGKLLGVNGKLVSADGVIPAGSTYIEENGTYDISSFAEVVVDVAGGGGLGRIRIGAEAARELSAMADACDVLNGMLYADEEGSVAYDYDMNLEFSGTYNHGITFAGGDGYKLHLQCVDGSSAYNAYLPYTGAGVYSFMKGEVSILAVVVSSTSVQWNCTGSNFETDNMPTQSATLEIVYDMLTEDVGFYDGEVTT